MSTRISIQEITLKPEITVEMFENFVKNEASTFVWENGVSHQFAKYDSGEKKCDYLFILEQSEEHHNLPEEEKAKLNEQRNEANPQNRIIAAKMFEYIDDWRWPEGFTNYFSMD